jgi:hypothetical protein
MAEAPSSRMEASRTGEEVTTTGNQGAKITEILFEPFLYKMFCAAFLSINFWLEIFCEIISEQKLLEMLMQLTRGVKLRTYFCMQVICAAFLYLQFDL